MKFNILGLLLFPAFTLLMVYGCSIVPLPQSYEGKSSIVYESAGCEIRKEFSKLEMVDRFCFSEVKVVRVCGGHESSIYDRYLAVPLNINNCEGLQLNRDFFSEKLYESDSYFLNAVREIAVFVRGSVIEKSDGLEMVDHGVIKELSELQMAAGSELRLSLIQQGDVDRFNMSFHLPRSQSVLSLSINEDGSDPEWGEVR